jgi:hypothetical protein
VDHAFIQSGFISADGVMFSLPLHKYLVYFIAIFLEIPEVIFYQVD